jgi:F-type H+-transporting ATPase subunit b
MTEPVLIDLALAASEAHPLLDWDSTAFIQLGLFAVVAIVASQLIFKPYLKMRAERAEGTEGSRQKAAEMQAEAAANLADYEARLAAARARANEERRVVRSDTAAYQRELADKTRAEIADATATAEQQVAEQSAAARGELLPRAPELGKQIASRLLGRELSA